VSRRAIGIIIAIVGIAVAVVGVFSIRQILIVSLAPPPSAPQALPVTEKVVVVTRDLAVGDVIKPDDVRQEDIPVSLIPRNAIREIDEVTGHLTKVPLVTGEMILAHHIADPTNVSHDIGFTMSDSLVMMAFPATDLISSLNVFQRGDAIDILVTIEEEIEPDQTVTTGGEPVAGDGANQAEEEQIRVRSFTFDAMQATQISAVIADIQYEQGNYSSVPLGNEAELISSETPPPSEIKVKAYLLILNPQDALVLKHLIDIGGKFDIVLRAPTSDQLFDLQPVMSEYIIDRYQLEIPR
jgi:Flp pilus assembly protein CpaB